MNKSRFHAFAIILTLFTFFMFSCTDKMEKEVVNYYPDSTVMVEKYYKWFENQRYMFKEIRYFPDGTKEKESIYNQFSKKDGKWTYWHDNGKKWIEENYKNDIKQGEFIEWYKSGEKYYQGKFENGMPDGEWIYWDGNGKKIINAVYENGKKIKEEKY